MASSLQPKGNSSFLTYTYLAKIYSLMSYLVLPLYGLLPNINSYVMTPKA